MMRSPLLALALLLVALPAAAGSAFESVDLGLKASAARETSTDSFDWGPTFSLGVISSDKDSRWRFKDEVEYDYDDYSSKLTAGGTSETSRVRAHEFKYAKVSLQEAAGHDLKELLHFVPYVSGGVQYVDSRSTNDGITERQFFWTPTWGAGIEFALSKRTSLALDFDANTQGGDRRVAHLSLELSVALFGEDE